MVQRKTAAVLFFLGSMVLASTALSQEPPGVAWEFVYPPSSNDQGTLGAAYRVIQLEDGSYALAGEYSLPFTSVFCLIRLNQYGNPYWAWSGDTAGISSVRWVEEDSGSLIATGSWNNVSGRRLMLARVSYDGNTIWRKTYNQLERSWGMCLTVLPDSDIIAGGRAYSESSYIPLLIRTDSEGNLIFSKAYDEYNGTIVRVMYHNDMIYAFINTINVAPLLMAVNPYTLSKEWVIDYAEQLPEDEGSICEPNSQSGILMVAGGVQARLNDDGQILWESQPPGSDNRTLHSASSTFDGGYILSGIVNMSLEPGQEIHPYDGWLVRTDGFGNTLWWLADSNDPDNTFYYSAEQTEGGGYIVGGSRCFPNGKRALLVVRYEPETGCESGDSRFQTSLMAVPNPFENTLNISYSIGEVSEVSLRVLDLSGREMVTLVSGQTASGSETATWTPAITIPEGCYLLVLDACGERIIRRTVLLR